MAIYSISSLIVAFFYARLNSLVNSLGLGYYGREMEGD